MGRLVRYCMVGTTTDFFDKADKLGEVHQIRNADVYWGDNGSLWEDAHSAMCEKVAEVKGVQVEEIKESYLSGEEYEEDTCVLENSAWSERHGNNFDWKIFGVEENLL